jgi:phage terminase small subunit
MPINGASSINKFKNNPRQSAFCREYIKDYNGAQAAIRAGYSKHTAAVTASTLLTRANIQQELQSLESRIENKVFISKEKILRELAMIGFSNIADHVDVDDSGCTQAVSVVNLPIGASRAVKKLKERRVIKSTSSGDEVLESTLEYELHDKQSALVSMGKELGMFRERVNVSVTGVTGDKLNAARERVKSCQPHQKLITSKS